MSEGLQTRREVTIETQNTPESLKPVEQLQRVGLLTTLQEANLYHGRNGNGEYWKVIELDNSGNNTGNHNVNKIPGLNTGTYDVANDFAQTRTNRANRRKAPGDRLDDPEVHHIISHDPDASVINYQTFDWSRLSPEEYAKTKKAIRETLPSVFEGSPVSFQYKEQAQRLRLADFKKDHRYGGLITKDMVSRYARENNIPVELSRQICGSINARTFLGQHPTNMMFKVMDAFMHNSSELTASYKKGDSQRFPINREYVATWLQNIHAVGARMAAWSATIGRDIYTNILFDQEHINAETEIEKQRRERDRRLGRLVVSRYNGIGDWPQPGKTNRVSETLNNLYTSPEEIVRAAKEVPGYKKLFEADAGNWERFSLEEHTETVLRFFDYNYADTIPAKILPIMRLGLLVHDIGKSEAAARGEKRMQGKYNMPAADLFMRQIGVDDRNRELVLNLIGPGKEMVAKYELGGRPFNQVAGMIQFCAGVFEQYTGQKATENDAIGIYDLCLMMQTCDSAAYTTMALTRSKENPDVYYRNFGSFDNSFDKAQGLTHRKGRFKA